MHNFVGLSTSDATLCGTLALVLVTAYYAWQNHRMVSEMVTTREMATQPKLALRLVPVGPMYGFPRIENVGPGPALDIDVTLVFEKDGSPIEQRQWRCPLLTSGEGHEFIGPDRPGTTGPMTLKDLAEHFTAIRLSGRLTDSAGKQRDVSDCIDDLAGYQRLLYAAGQTLEESDLAKIAKALKKLEESGSKIERKL